MSEKIDVLDAGYVRLVDVMGDDLSVVNAARVSFARESESLDKKDERLIRFLVREDHTSPFRHAMATFEVKAPLMIARQWWKYVVGSDHTMDGWNEVSRRYVDAEPEFYIPSVWRGAPEDRKQGSEGVVGHRLANALSREMKYIVKLLVNRYRQAINSDICAEQARLFLPAYAMYTTWRWTASLQSILHFLDQRLAGDAQVEIQEYAQAVHDLIEPHFPVSVAAWAGERNGED